MGDLDVFFQGSSKKILALVKSLPNNGKMDDVLSRLTKTADGRRRRRFNRHPRKLKEDSSPESHKTDEDSKNSLVVLKTPTCRDALTDSSDEYCDVTVRKDVVTLNEDEDIEISDQILATVENKWTKKPCNKVEKERQNGVKRLDSKEDEVPKKMVSDKGDEEQPKIFLDRKVSGVIEQSLQALDDIGTMMHLGNETPDGSEDYERKRKRAIEFACRFSRIYLYQLNRHISEIQNVLKLAESGKSSHRSNAVILNQKFLAAHQVVVQGLQAYQKHLPTTVIDNVAAKFQDMLKSICVLCDVYKTCANREDAGDHSEDIIETLDSKCRSLIERTVERSKSNVSNVSLGDAKQADKKAKHHGKGKRLSMYHNVPIRNDVYWRKAIASIAQKKFDVPSRYKTASFKHRPPPTQPPQENDASTQQKGLHRSSLDKKISSANNCKCRPKKSSTNDIDNVTTLIQSQEEGEERRSEDNTVADRKGAMWNLAHGFFQKIFKDNETMTRGEYECILEHFITMMSDRKDGASGEKNDRLEQDAQELLQQKLGSSIEKMKFKEFVDKLVEYMNVEKKEGDTEPDDPRSSHKIVQRPPTVTVSGTKNAQLICIKDDNSLLDTSAEERPAENGRTCRSSTNTRAPSKPSFRSSNHAKPEDENVLIYRETAEEDPKSTCPRLARVNKQNLKPLTMLSNDALVRVIEYKLQFHKETKHNCMYKKSGSKSPWVLVDWITEELMEEVLQSIARDIQVDDILKKIYAHEFK